MTIGWMRRYTLRCAFLAIVVVLSLGGSLIAQSQKIAAKPDAVQKMDEEYTAKIKEYTQDPRILTELVDHLPASATVPTPLKALGRIPGTPDELTYYKDIKAYFETLAKAAPGRSKLFTIGKSEEGRDMIVLAIADEATIKALDNYKKILADLTDPRKLTTRGRSSSSPPENPSTGQRETCTRVRRGAPKCRWSSPIG